MPSVLSKNLTWIWSDFYDVTIKTVDENDNEKIEVIDALHNNTKGAFMGRFTSLGTSQIAIENFVPSKVEWHVYQRGQFDKVSEWPFYRIPPMSHAYTYININTGSSHDYKIRSLIQSNFNYWYVEAPMYVHTTPNDGKYKSGLLSANGRYKNNCVVIALEVCWTKISYNADGKEIFLPTSSDNIYENLHFINGALDSNALDKKYTDGGINRDLMYYGAMTRQKLPVQNISGYKRNWICLHIYNSGNLTLYCPGINVGLE